VTGQTALSQALKMLLLVVCGVVAVLIPLLPMQFDTQSRTMPDLLLPLLVLWSIRRPDTAPLILVAALLLFADLALERPVGLWALICLLIVEALRGQRGSLRGRPFPAEWASFAIALGIGLAIQGLVLFLALAPQPSASVMLEFYMATLFSYPAIASLLHWVFRIRAPKPEERSRRLGRVS